jgi:hypothetical protein
MKLINLVIHDTNGAIGLWKEALDAEVNGCLLYYNGWKGPDRCHAHGIYTQNDTGTKRIVDNIIFKNFMFGTQDYGSGQAFLDGYHFEGNTYFNSGAIGGKLETSLLIGGGKPVDRMVIQNNCFYNTDRGRWVADLGYFYGQPNKTMTLKNNWFAGHVAIRRWNTLHATGNTIFGPITEDTAPGADAKLDRQANTVFTDRPKGANVFVRPNQFAAGRAHITVYNWDLADSIQADVSAVLKPGDIYEVRDAQNYFAAPVVKGTWDGKPISLPMKGLKAAEPVAIVEKMTAHTAPEFAVFVICKTVDGPQASRNK